MSLREDIVLRTGLCRAFFAAGIALAMTVPTFADEISDEIARAQKLYREGKLAEAKQSLDMASQLLSEKKANALGDVLPKPGAGWTVDRPEAASGTTGFFGGISTSRTYRRQNTTCRVSVVGDSPLIAMVSTFLANPTMAGATGAKMRRIAGQRALITAEGDVQVLSVNNFLVTVSGDTCPQTDKLVLAESVDYKALQGF